MLDRKQRQHADPKQKQHADPKQNEPSLSIPRPPPLRLLFGDVAPLVCSTSGGDGGGEGSLEGGGGTPHRATHPPPASASGTKKAQTGKALEKRWGELLVIIPSSTTWYSASYPRT